MTASHYIQEPTAEWEAVERWENEGGSVEQRQDYVLDSFGKDLTRPGGMEISNDEAIDSGGFSDFN